MKLEEYKDEKLYHRGRDYPPYAKGKTNPMVKMAMSMYGKEIKEWFKQEDLEEYPDKKGYMGSLP